MKHFKKAHRNMIFGQFLPNKLTDPNVLHAFEMVWREDFVPDPIKALSYCDQPVPLTASRSMLSSLSFMRLLHAASITKKETVLYVGAGTGYGAVVTAYLAKKVIALESEASLFKSLSHLPDGYDVPNMTPIKGSLVEGAPALAPFDVIFVEGALTDVPATLLSQLKEGGRLLMYRPMRTQHAGASVDGVATAIRIQRFGTHFSTIPLFQALAHPLHIEGKGDSLARTDFIF